MPEKKKDFPVIDVDSHILEPAAIWDEYVPHDYRALARSSSFGIRDVNTRN